MLNYHKCFRKVIVLTRSKAKITPTANKVSIFIHFLSWILCSFVKGWLHRMCQTLKFEYNLKILIGKYT